MGFWEPLFFWILAFGAIATSVALLTFRNPLYSALALIADFICFAGLYAMLSAHFLAIIQILVYAGAIMVLFVFIIMLLNLGDAELGPRRFALHHVLAALGGVVVFGITVGTFFSVVDGDAVRQERERAAEAQTETDAEAEETGERGPKIKTESLVPGLYVDLSERSLRNEYHQKLRDWKSGEARPSDQKYRPYAPERSFEIPPAMEPEEQLERNAARGETKPRGNLFGTVEPISLLLVNRFVVPFELTAVLLLAAIFGAVIIAKKRL